MGIIETAAINNHKLPIKKKKKSQSDSQKKKKKHKKIQNKMKHNKFFP